MTIYKSETVLDAITIMVCEHFQISRFDLKSPKSIQPLPLARQLVAWIARKCGQTNSAIEKFLSRSKGWAIKSVQHVSGYLSTDAKLMRKATLLYVGVAAALFPGQPIILFP